MNPLAIVHTSSMLLVALGGACGCLLRFLSVQFISRWNPGTFPLGTMFVNVVGSLLVGMVLAKYGSEHTIRAFFVTGVIGGFTTFSAFSWDAVQLLSRGQYGAALLYVGGSVGLCLALTALGFHIARSGAF